MSTPDPAPPAPETGVLGLQLNDKPASRGTIFAWALWDWATQPFGAVILTFIFTALYLTTEVFLDPSVAALPDDDPVKVLALADLASGLGWGTTVAGVLILLFAPVLGQQADASGRQKLWLGIGTAGLIVSTLGLWFVEPTPTLFWLGVGLVSAGTVFSEIAAVNSNAMLIGISTPTTVGRISGIGWGAGYLGGIVALVIVIVFYGADWFGLPDDNGLPFRIIAIGCAVWTIAFCLPIFFKVPEPSLGRPERKVGFFRSYVVLVQDVRRLFANPETRSTGWFLLASAVFRDGLGGVFTFGAVIAQQVFGFGFLDLVIFAIAANVVAGVTTILVGRLDDVIGPKRIILGSIGIICVASLVVFFFADSGAIVFWVAGLVLSAMVGPAQSASRSFLARLTPAGRQGEIFGLYATTGRAASWIASAMWSVLIIWGGSTSFGILGIGIVLVLGFVLLLPIRARV